MRLPAIAVLLSALLVAGCATGERASQPKQNQKSTNLSGGSSSSTPQDPVAGAAHSPTAQAQAAAGGPSYAEAARELAAGHIDAAIATFEALVKENPKDIESQVQFARLLMSAGRLAEARRVLDRVLSGAPHDPGAQYAMALLEGAEGNTAAEQKLLEALIAAYPKNAEANASLGEIYLGQNQTGKAQAAFQQSLATDPSNVTALLGDGEILLNVDKKPKEALARFERAVEVQPDLSFAYAGRAEAEVALDNIAGAEKDLTKAIALNPSYYWHYIDRGRLRLVFEHDTEGALADFSKAISLQPGYFLGYVYRAGLYEQLGKNDAALTDYRKLLELRPDYYFAYRPYAILLYEKKEWGLSAEYFLKAAKADPTDFGLQFLPAIIYLKEGKSSMAADYLTRLVGELPQSSMFYRLAQLYLEPGNDAEFLSDLQAERNPDKRVRMLFYLACFYELHGKTDLAQRYFLDVQSHPVEGMYEYKLNEAELRSFR